MTAAASGRTASLAVAPVTFPRVVLSEWTKVRSLRSTVWSLVVAVVLTIGLGIAISAARAAHWQQEDFRDRLLFDPTATSLSGVFMAQLAIGVLGVLLVTGEYTTGMIRATFAAVPRRLPVLWAKVLVYGVVALLLMVIACVLAFLGGQWMLSSQQIDTTFGQPGVARAVVGAALYLTVVGLLGLALGALLRNTAGAIATLFGLLLILPLIVFFLPSSWSHAIQPYLPSTAGQAVMAVVHVPYTLEPWPGFGVFCGYVAFTLAMAAVVLLRRDV